MAASPSHELGEKIGVFFEDVMKAPVRKICEKYHMYFDTIRPRPARHSKKVTWTDINGNKHDLDYVIEKNGTDNQIGEPIGFIELAWRRYTKHSKNKVQEIAGAVLPIAEKYASTAPFKGAILSGDFTESSLNQLKREGFKVLYIPFEKVVAAFGKHNIDINYCETTPEIELTEKVKQFNNCTDLDAIQQDFIESISDELNVFIGSLESFLKRVVEYIFVLPLHGKEEVFTKTNEAIDFISQYSNMPTNAPIDRYIVRVVYSDESDINCNFKEKEVAISFLQNIHQF